MNPSKTISRKDIRELRKALRFYGCQYLGIKGWFSPSGRPIGIFHDGTKWFATIVF